MHQHSQAEADTLASEHYGIEVRTALSLVDEGININSLTADGSVLFPHVSFPASRRGVMALKPLASRILGYEPFVSATISADLDQLVTEAEIRMHLASGADSLSPFMAGPAWDFGGFFGVATELRALFDVGVYLQLQGRYVSQVPRVVLPPSPTFVNRGTLVQTAGDGIGVTPTWPSGHATNDIGLLFVITANEVATVSVPAGFVEIPGSPQGTGTAGAAGSVRLAIYWCRATSTAMASPTILNPGNHVIARILAWRGCIETGSPFELNPVGSVLATTSTTVTYPAVTPIASARTNVIRAFAGATDTLADQTVTPPSVNPGGGISYLMTGRTDSWRDIGNGGGFAVYDLPWNQTGTTGTSTQAILTATAQARYTIVLKAAQSRTVVDDPSTVPWRPFFTGRIDSVDPASGGDDTLVLRCRDMYSDVLDDWMIPQLGQSGFTMTNELNDDVGDLLRNLFSLRSFLSSNNGCVFAVDGDPGMIVPTYFQEPMSPYLAMRTAGLQNGWDLRPRWGTPPFGQDQLVLTYYEPDRGLAGFVGTLEANRYFGLSSLGLSRDEVRNHWRVTPSDPPRSTIDLLDDVSPIKYGFRFAEISEDATSLVATEAQATILANALLSDTSEPKFTAEVERRFFPYVEINDLYILGGNAVHLLNGKFVAVTGYTHTLGPKPGVGNTVIRARSRPAAANLEWRQRTTPKTTYISTDAPTGSAVQGARWDRVRP